MFKDVQDAQGRVKEDVSKELDSLWVFKLASTSHCCHRSRDSLADIRLSWFHSLMQDPNKPADLQVVKEACLVVDVLGTDYR